LPGNSNAGVYCGTDLWQSEETVGEYYSQTSGNGSMRLVLTEHQSLALRAV